MQWLKYWLDRVFSNSQTLLLTMMLILTLAAVVLLGNILAPVFAAVVIAYLLEGVVRRLVQAGMPRSISAPVSFSVFIVASAAMLIGLLPLLSRQLSQLVQQLPVMLADGQNWIMQLPARYPELFTEGQVLVMIDRIRDELGAAGQSLVEMSLASVVGLIAFMVYLVLVPLMVFFFLKDKDDLIQWFLKFMPEERALPSRVWRDVDRQIGNYIRGKFWEILIVWFASYIAFVLIGLQFAMLLSLVVGLSVIIPYIGATVVTIPVLAVGMFQFGWSSDLAVLAIVYGVIQALDGNVLVPLLFSEVVNLHPIAIIVAILFFGGIWGFWGVFFAIPLATVVQAVITAWPDEDVASP